MFLHYCNELEYIRIIHMINYCLQILMIQYNNYEIGKTENYNEKEELLLFLFAILETDYLYFESIL